MQSSEGPRADPRRGQERFDSVREGRENRPGQLIFLGHARTVLPMRLEVVEGMARPPRRC